MYKVIRDPSFDNLCNKIITNINQKPETYIKLIGYDHSTLKFEFARNEISTITYMESQTKNTFNIPLIFQEVHYQISFHKNHPYYNSYVNSYDNPTHTSILKYSEHIVGIRICDLIKHFFLINNINDFEETSIFERYDKNFKIYMIGLIKKLLRTDFSQFENKNSIGLLDYIQNKITLWTTLMNDKLINKCNFNFNDYFQKIIYFCPNIYWRCVTIATSIEKHLYYFDYDKFAEVLSNISNENLIFKFIRHFKYNEDPNLDESIQTYYFDPPKKISDVMLSMYEITKNNNYKRMYDMLEKRINKHMKEMLDIKYTEYVVDSIEDITTNIPFYALKNMYVTRWNTHDIAQIEFLYERSMDVFKSKYYKHRINKMDDYKYIPYDEVERHAKRWYYRVRYQRHEFKFMKKLNEDD